jgi:hypothetical protein
MAFNLFDSEYFVKGHSPWPNQVFYKDFDAYFLLSYPPFQYSVTEVHNPFSFLNNIDERTIYIETPDGKASLNHTIPSGTYNYEAYDQKFHSTFKEEQFLFWQSENSKWAMVSDNTNKVCVLATTWQIADQVPMFYTQCLLSPTQFLEKIKCVQHKAIFLKNYQPSPTMTKGDAENKVWKKYYIQCHVEHENDKLFYWKQFEKLFYACEILLKPFKGIDLYADQIFDRRYFKKKQWYSSASNAPVGGWQKLSLENCKKVATKFLAQNEHLILDFEGKRQQADEMFIASKQGLIMFLDFYIYANVLRQTTKGAQPDFALLMASHGPRAQLYNQQFQFFYQADLLLDDAVEKFITSLRSFCFIEQILEVQQPKVFAEYTADKPLQIHGIYSFVPEQAIASI